MLPKMARKKLRNYLRVRGEYPPRLRAHRGKQELPPRARRIPATASASRSKQGTTSACAENTKMLLIDTGDVRNYLRVRGEYFLLR